MSAAKTSDGRYRSAWDERTATPGVYRRGNYYRVLTRPDGHRKVMRRFETYEEAVAFKQTTPNRKSPKRWGVAGITRTAWTDVLRRDPCAYCGGPSETLDHIEPRVFGGADNDTNLVGACRSCNSSKQADSLLIFLAHRNGCWEWRQDAAKATQPPQRSHCYVRRSNPPL